jgi:hypothetical protein
VITPTSGGGIFGGPFSLPLPQALNTSRLRHSSGVLSNEDFMGTPGFLDVLVVGVWGEA